MKTIFNFIAIMGLLFFGSLVLCSLGLLVLYNEIGNIFEFEAVNVEYVRVENNPNNENILDVYYAFKAENNKIEGKIDLHKIAFSKGIKNVDSIRICYNTLYPSVHYIEGVKTSDAYYFIAAIFSFFLCIYIYWFKFANKEYWYELYGMNK